MSHCPKISLPGQNKYVASAWMTAEELVKKRIAKPGDLIEFNRKYYCHWAIVEYLNDGIIQFTGEPNDKKGAKITRGSLKETAGQSLIRINNLRDYEHEKQYKSLDTCDMMLQRARSRIGKACYVDGKHLRYDVLYNNCEHFATFCRYGIPYVGQSKVVHRFNHRNNPLTKRLPLEIQKWVEDLNILPINEEKVAIIINDREVLYRFMDFLICNNEKMQIFALEVFYYINEYGCNSKLINSQTLTKVLEKCITKLYCCIISKTIFIQKKALKLLDFILDERKNLKIESCIILAVVESLESSDTEAVQHAANILIPIVTKTNENMITAVKAGAISKMVEFLFSDSTHGNVYKNAMHLLKAFIFYQDFNDKMLNEYNIMEHIYQYLNSSNVEVRENKIVHYSVAWRENFKQNVIDAGLVPFIVDFLSSNNNYTVYVSVQTLRNIARETVQQGKSIDSAFPILLNIFITKCTDYLDDLICYEILCTFTTVFHSGIHINAIGRPDVLKKISEYIKLNDNNIKKAALYLICEITACDKCQKQVTIELYIISLIVECLNSDDSNVVGYALFILSNIARKQKKQADAVINAVSAAILKNKESRPSPKKELMKILYMHLRKYS